MFPKGVAFFSLGRKFRFGINNCQKDSVIHSGYYLFIRIKNKIISVFKCPYFSNYKIYYPLCTCRDNFQVKFIVKFK